MCIPAYTTKIDVFSFTVAGASEGNEGPWVIWVSRKSFLTASHRSPHTLRVDSVPSGRPLRAPRSPAPRSTGSSWEDPWCCPPPALPAGWSRSSISRAGLGPRDRYLQVIFILDVLKVVLLEILGLLEELCWTLFFANLFGYCDRVPEASQNELLRWKGYNF